MTLYVVNLFSPFSPRRVEKYSARFILRVISRAPNLEKEKNLGFFFAVCIMYVGSSTLVRDGIMNKRRTGEEVVKLT